MDEQSYCILVINDDGPQSPLLIPFLDAIASKPWCRELRVVVPAQEQSWIAKAVSRFRALKAQSTRLGNHASLLVDGTPADCASLGIHNLFPSPPDFVFSGINMGTNAGEAFLLSSGTVGGVIESALYRVPGIAFSAHIPAHIFDLWRNHDVSRLAEFKDDWARLSEAAARSAGKLVYDWDSNVHDLISVNIPWSAAGDTPLIPTSLTETHFHALFAEVAPGEYRHKFQGLKTVDRSDPHPHPYAQDIPTLEKHAISINPVKFQLDGHLSPKQLERLKSGS